MFTKKTIGQKVQELVIGIIANIRGVPIEKVELSQKVGVAFYKIKEALVPHDLEIHPERLAPNISVRQLIREVKINTRVKS
jgi:hypothetical protein